MEYTITRNEEAEADLLITFSVEDINQAYDKAFEKAQKKVKLNGFRQGKAPLEMVKKAIKEESLTEDAINDLLNDSIHHISHKLEFAPYVFPKLHIEKFDRKSELSVKATYEKSPDVILGEYKNLPISNYKINLTDDLIDKEFKAIAKKLSKTASREENETVQEKDLVELEISSTKEGETVADTSTENIELGTNPAFEKFDVEILGLKLGEEKTFSFTFPTDNETVKDIAGQTYNYHIRVLSISKIVYPEIDDNLAKEWNEKFQTLQELKDEIIKNYHEQFEAEFKNKNFAIMLSSIVKDSKFIIPPTLMLDEKNGIFERIKERTKLNDLTIEKYSEVLKQPLEETNTNLLAQAERNIKNYLAIHKISATESLSITPIEVNDVYESVTKGLKTKPDSNQKRNILSNIHSNLVQEKVEKFLFSNAKQASIEEISVEKANEILNHPI